MENRYNEISEKGSHWADIWADKIIREYPDTSIYTCAAGITPSGVIHIGNFREIISVALVVRALKEKGKTVRFLYSWDDYDVFRKVPENMPQQELLTSYLRCPITSVPDVIGDEKSYADYNEKQIIKLLPLLGIEPEYLYQSKAYRNSNYAEPMNLVLQKKEIIRDILNQFRSTDLAEDWWPVSAFCSQCNKDTVSILSYDNDYQIEYHCEHCDNQEIVDLRTTSTMKLPWRIDWPMRWAQENVHFEPAGKDHHSQGGSFDTAREISSQIFGYQAPLTFQYDFIRIKGGAGKISSSSGAVVSLQDVLNVYEPEVLLYLFVGTKPNSEFAISFDLDVIKNYEDYDKVEREYYQQPATEKALKKWYKGARTYELSQTNTQKKPDSKNLESPFQIAFRHLSTLLQTHDNDFDLLWSRFGNGNNKDKERIRKRALCVSYWLENYADESFIFQINTGNESELIHSFSEQEKLWLKDLSSHLQTLQDTISDKELNNELYARMHAYDQTPDIFFPVIYRAIIGKEKGPKLAAFINLISIARVQNLLDIMAN